MNLAAKEGRVAIRHDSSISNGSSSDTVSQREKELLLKFVRLMQGRVGLNGKNVWKKFRIF